jgi:hypothetical protein
VEPQSIVEFRPRQEGNTLHAILAPKKSAAEREKEKEKEAKAKAKAERQEKMLQEKMAQAKLATETPASEKKDEQPAVAAAAGVEAPNSGSQA